MDISFVIPAYNEESSLPFVFQSIKKYVPKQYSYEVIVADNGSSDKTVDLARGSGARVLVKTDGTVSALRNAGVALANGTVLIFLDADVVLTQRWSENVAETISNLQKHSGTITGSWCGVGDDPGWIERFWYKPLLKGGNTHINSGHLIVVRAVFDKLKGFSEELESGEDYDFSIRAKDAGIEVVDNPRLYVIHLGYPASVIEFVRREIWHGKGDYKSVGTFVRSKVALIAMTFLAAHVGLIVSVLLAWGAYISWVLFLIIVLIPMGASVCKYRDEDVTTILVDAVIYYFYFLSRGIAFFVRLREPSPTRTTTPRKTLDV